ncbi:MAG: tetratricopeptide repeat protein [Planctomycetales bacterium]|nr:tetratricopeptide repeat protein [bacterium]UNM09943.1 MAG: tetratricopeptide repeat protein [Planctomycetales bacterium]
MAPLGRRTGRRRKGSRQALPGDEFARMLLEQIADPALDQASAINLIRELAIHLHELSDHQSLYELVRDTTQPELLRRECALAFRQLATELLASGPQLDEQFDEQHYEVENWLVALDPADLEARRNRVELLIGLGAADLAADDIEYIERADPDDGWLWEIRGLLLFNAGMYEEALSQYSSLQAREPLSVTALTGIAQCLGRLGRFEEAVETCDLLLTYEFEGMWEVRFERAVLLRDLCEFDRALDDFNACEGMPLAGSLYFDRGLCLFLMSRLADSIADFDNDLEQPDRQDLSLWYRGCARLRMGELEGALDDFEQYQRIGGDSEFIHQGLGQVFLRRGEFESADYHLRAALGGPMADHFSRFLLATLNRRRGDEGQAGQRFDEAVEIIGSMIQEGQDDWHSRSAMAFYEAVRGETEAAVLNYQIAMRHAQNEYLVRLELENLEEYARMFPEDEAVDVCSKLLTKYLILIEAGEFS